MPLSQVLLESRTDDFILKYRDKFNDETIKKIIKLSHDLSTNHKYLNFLGKALPNNLDDSAIAEAKEIINKFKRYKDVLKEKDLNKYNSLSEITRAIYNHENKIRREYKKVDGATIVYENDRFTVIMPETHAASCYYGAGTKWCTASMNGDSHFRSYSSNGRLFYILDKKAKTNDKYYKVALSKKFTGQETFYTADDDSFTTGWIFGTPEWDIIKHNIDNFFNEYYDEFIEKAQEEERKRIEKERERQRQYQQERRRILQQRLEDSRNNREDAIFAINGDDDDDEDAERAHALFLHLGDEGVVDEGEDIYYLLPQPYGYVQGSEFMWIGNDRYESEYRVLTDAEADDASIEYLKELFNEMGMEGINRDFALNYLHEDQLRYDMRNYYEDDIRECPECYFSDVDYEISDEQEKEIEKLEEEIAKYKEMIENEKYDNEEEKEEWEDKISDMEDDIENIRENPDKELTDEMVEQKADEMVDDFMYDPIRNMENWGLNFEDYFDVDAWAEAAVNADGRGHHLSGYDGVENEENINGTWYYIYRTN